MVLEKLGDSLRNTLQKIAKSLFVDERLIDEVVKDIQRALLASDVNVKLVFELTKRIKERALKETATGITKKEQIIKIVYEELTIFLGDQDAQIDISKKPTKIMLAGLFGSGKTTAAGKLAKYYTKRAQKVALVQLDTMRPAAYEQLQQLGAQVGAQVYGNPKEKNPVKILRQFENEFKDYNIVILDTAGRDALSKDLIEELNQIYKAAGPEEVLLVISGDIGQAAEAQATAFHESCRITGIIITKLEGTAKGGGAIAACRITKAPVKFIGVGEKIDDLEKFDPKGFVGRLLGMGDLQALLEKASEAVTEEEAKDMSKKMLKGEFNLIDLYEQMEAMSKMGPLSKLVEMIPGFSQIKLPKEALQVQEGKLKKWRFAMDSMSREELEDPEIIDGDRAERIAKGSGLTTTEVRDLIKQYKQSKKLMKMMKPGEKGMDRLMKRFSSGNVKM